MLSYDEKQVILEVLNPYNPSFVGLFGSYARGEETPESDIDILVDFEKPPKRFLEYRVSAELEDKLQKPVDVVQCCNLLELYKEHIFNSLLELFPNNSLEVPNNHLKMEKTNRKYLEDIQQAVDLILKYTRPLNYTRFCNNDLVFRSVERYLEIIGEASGNLSKDLKERHKRIIPLEIWKDMKNMRNIIIHNYDNVSYKLIWETVKKDIPLLGKGISEIIEKERHLGIDKGFTKTKRL